MSHRSQNHAPFSFSKHQVPTKNLRGFCNIEATSTYPGRGHSILPVSVSPSRTVTFVLCRENESLLRGARGKRNTPLSLYGLKVARGGASVRRHRRPGRLLRGRHEEVRSDNNEFRCRPFRPSRSASRKLGFAASAPPVCPLRRETFFFAARCRTIASNFYCTNPACLARSPRLIRERGVRMAGRRLGKGWRGSLVSCGAGFRGLF